MKPSVDPNCSGEALVTLPGRLIEGQNVPAAPDDGPTVRVRQRA